jgi:hypothetical protein
MGLISHPVYITAFLQYRKPLVIQQVWIISWSGYMNLIND